MFAGRLRKASARMFRRVPNRFDMELYDARGELRTKVDDCWQVAVAEQDAVAVINTRGLSLTWKVPVVNLPDDVEPKSSDRLRETDSGKLWEIRAARLETFDATWHCVCVELEEHEGAAVP